MAAVIHGYSRYTIDRDGTIIDSTTGSIVKHYVQNNYVTVILFEDVNPAKPLGKPKMKTLRLNRLLGMAFIPNPLNLPIVDHKDRNKLNNDLSNLRWATYADNVRNISIRKDNTSGFPGVSYVKKRKMYRAYIYVDGVQKYLGDFILKEDAIRVRVAAAEIEHGEFAAHLSATYVPIRRRKLIRKKIVLIRKVPPPT